MALPATNHLGQDSDIIAVPYSGTVRRGDLLRWSSGKGVASAAGTASQTDATLAISRIGIAIDSSEDKDSYGNNANPTYVRVRVRGQMWLPKETPTTAPTLGNYVATNAISSATAVALYEASGTAADALGIVIGYENPHMLVMFDFTGNYEQA